MDVAASMFFFLMVLTVAVFQFKIYAYMAAGAYVEDALAASGLASALIDLEEYGRNHTIRIEDTRDAFRVYQSALQYNLALDEGGCSAKTELLKGSVRLEEYIVYNVVDGYVQTTVYDGQGNCLRQDNAPQGAVRTPDGIIVGNTTIYSRVLFQVEGLMGQVIDARKEKSVDITRRGDGP